MDNTTVEKMATCPNIHYFGAPYVDAGCIDGLLWDLDSCDDNNMLSSGGEIPCPFCNTQNYIEYIKDDMYDGTEIDDDGNLTIPESELIVRANLHVENLKKKYL